MCRGELAVSQEKRRIAGQGLIKKLHRLKKILSLARRANIAVIKKSFRPQIEIVRGDVSGRPFIDGTLFLRRELGLKLISDGLRNLALDGEDIRQVSIIFLRPDVGVI